MKIYSLLLGLVICFSSIVNAQITNPGGGQLDPTKQGYERLIDYKKLENAFKLNIKNNWIACGFPDSIKAPSTFVNFYRESRDLKILIDPNSLIIPKEPICVECLKDHTRPVDNMNYQCLLHNKELQKILNIFANNSVQSKSFIQHDVDKINKSSSNEKLDVNQVFIFYKKLIIGYE